MRVFIDVFTDRLRNNGYGLWAPRICARYSQNLKEKTGHMKQMTQELEMYHNQAGSKKTLKARSSQAESIHDDCASSSTRSVNRSSQ